MSIGAFSALVAIGLFTLVTWVFVIRYLHKGTWHLTREGKTLLFMKICLAVLCTTLFVFRYWFAGPEWFEYRAYFYTGLFLIMTWMMVRFNKYLVVQSDKEAKEAVNE